MADKKVIALTNGARGALDRIMALGMFQTQLDAAKFALAVAIRKGLSVEDIGSAETTWNVGSFDDNNDVKNAIMAIFPDATEPYRVAEALLNRGAIYIADRLGRNPQPEALLGLVTK